MSIVALCSGHNSLGNSDDIAILNLKACALGSIQNGLDHDFAEIVALTDDGGSDSSGNGTD